MRVVEILLLKIESTFKTAHRCDRPCMVSRGSLPSFRGPGFSSVDLEWFYPRCARSIAKKLSTQQEAIVLLLEERIRRIDQHHGFVKGVCWDPVGEFLATQSDDRSVKIWRTTDWELEAEVRKPFEDSPGSTFFRRLR
jgi:WD40 repeat protein